MLRLASYTFGCKLNQSESETALGLLVARGYEVVDWEAGADFFLINTCTVTSKVEQKVRGLIRRVLREASQAVVLVTGCYAVVEGESLRRLGDRVCVVADQPARVCQFLADQPEPPANSDELLVLLKANVELFQTRTIKINQPRSIDFPFPEAVKKSTPRQRYFLKIQDGCNRQCSFCRIRIARGLSRSLPLPELVSRLRHLEGEGYREIVITGVHINSYHYEEGGRVNTLGDLLLAMLEATRLVRLRLSSLEPEDWERNASRNPSLKTALRSPRICPHFHISLQSGSDFVLRQMRRIYSSQTIRDYVKELSDLRSGEDPFFSCDVIVGFPGERREDFEATLELLRELNFSAVHAFSYSPRPGTEAAGMPSRLPESEIKLRMRELKVLSEKLWTRYLERQWGKTCRVLLEEFRDGRWRGTSENYLKIGIAEDSGEIGRSGARGRLVKVLLKRELNLIPEIPGQEPEDLLLGSFQGFAT